MLYCFIFTPTHLQTEYNFKLTPLMGLPKKPILRTTNFVLISVLLLLFYQKILQLTIISKSYIFHKKSYQNTILTQSAVKSPFLWGSHTEGAHYYLPS